MEHSFFIENILGREYTKFLRLQCTKSFGSDPKNALSTGGISNGNVCYHYVSKLATEMSGPVILNQI